MLVNLGSAVPPFFEKFARVAEFLDARPEVRAAGRERFKAYRGKSIEPQTHNVHEILPRPTRGPAIRDQQR